MEQGEVCGQAVPEEENSNRKTLCRDIPKAKILHLSDSYIFLNIITGLSQIILQGFDEIITEINEVSLW